MGAIRPMVCPARNDENHNIRVLECMNRRYFIKFFTLFMDHSHLPSLDPRTHLKLKNIHYKRDMCEQKNVHNSDTLKYIELRDIKK